MPEPAKDTAIEITPKARAASSVGVPRIVAEINRVAIILTYFAYALQKTLSPIKYESDDSFAHLSAHVFRFTLLIIIRETHAARNKHIYLEKKEGPNHDKNNFFLRC